MNDQAKSSTEIVDLAQRRYGESPAAADDVRPASTRRSRGKRLAIVGAFAVVIIAFVIIDSDSGARQQLASVWDNVTGLITGRDNPPAPANWGDVAAKVGEFAEGERALREALSPTLAVEPTPAP